MRKPYFRKDRQAWYVKTNGGRTQVRLHEDEKQAYKIWQEMQAVERPEAANATFYALVECFLTATETEVSKDYYERTGTYLAKFCNENESTLARELKPYHVNRWIDKQKEWGAWSKRAAIAAIKRVYEWAIEEGLIDRNPVSSVRLPTASRRETLITDDQHGQLMQVKPNNRRHLPGELAFRQVLIALRHSGARPGSVAIVTAENVSAAGDAWVLRKHKTAKKTKKPLTIYLSPCLQTLTRILVAHRPTGPLFLNARGKQWSRTAIRQRMARLRKKLGLPEGTVAYSYRHSWTTEAIMNGVDLATVAELLGHTSLKMIATNYAHLDQQKEHLKQAMLKANARKKEKEQ